MSETQQKIEQIDFELLLENARQNNHSLLLMPAALEQLYRQARLQALLTYRRLCLLFGLILIVITDLGEIAVYGQKWNQMILADAWVYALMLLLFVPLFTSRWFLRFQDWIVAVLACLLLLGAVLVLQQGMPSATALYLNVLLLLLTFMTAIFRLGVFASCMVMMSTLIGFNVLIVGLAPQDLEVVFSYNIFFLMLCAILLYANYCLDLASRRQFVQNMAIARERDNIKDIKLKLRTMASVDRLTGVMNHQEMYKSLNSEWRRLCRNEADLSLVLIGVDDFRAYNGCFGHKAGDAVLIKVARCISDTFKRASDVVARFDGELFLVMMPETGAGEAELMARSVLKRIVELAIEHPQSSAALVVTVSIGVASCRPDLGGGYEDLLAQAQDALESAKAQGKACYCIAEDMHRNQAMQQSAAATAAASEPIDVEYVDVDYGDNDDYDEGYDDDDDDTYIDDEDDDLVPLDEDDSIIDLSHEPIPPKRPT